MTLQQLRTMVHVSSYSTHIEGARIDYYVDGAEDAKRMLFLQIPDLCTELVAMGSLDENFTPEQYADYNLSQWDALNIVLRHEYLKALDADAEMMSITNLVDKLKQNTI